MIDSIISISARNKISVGFICAILCLISIFALKHIRLDALPDLTPPQVVLQVDFPNQSPKIIEEQIIYPLTQSLLAIANVQSVRAISMYESALIYVIFKDKTDLYWARSRILEQLNSVKNIPQNAKVSLGSDSTSVGWAYQYILKSESKDLGELRTLQDFYYKYALLGIDGVSEVASIGGFVRDYEITLDNDKIVLYDLSLSEIIEAIKRANDERGGGVLLEGGFEKIIRVNGYVQNERDIENLIIKVIGDVPLTIGDVGSVNIRPAARRGAAELNGEGEVVGGIVMVKYGGNTYETLQKIKEKIALLNGDLEGEKLGNMEVNGEDSKGINNNMESKNADSINLQNLDSIKTNESRNLDSKNLENIESNTQDSNKNANLDSKQTNKNLESTNADSKKTNEINNLDSKEVTESVINGVKKNIESLNSQNLDSKNLENIESNLQDSKTKANLDSKKLVNIESANSQNLDSIKTNENLESINADSIKTNEINNLDSKEVAESVINGVENNLDSKETNKSQNLDSKNLQNIESNTQDSVKIQSVYDRSELILNAVLNLLKTLFEECVIVLIVCVIFLLHFRSALIIMITLPLCVLFTFLLMYFFNIESSIMSLGGIAIAIGAMVDASIVMIENAHKNLALDSKTESNLQGNPPKSSPYHPISHPPTLLEKIRKTFGRISNTQTSQTDSIESASHPHRNESENSQANSNATKADSRFYTTNEINNLDSKKLENIESNTQDSNENTESKSQNLDSKQNADSRFYQTNEINNSEASMLRGEAEATILQSREAQPLKASSGGLGQKNITGRGDKGETILQIQAPLVPPAKCDVTEDSKEISKTENLDSVNSQNTESNTQDSNNLRNLDSIESTNAKSTQNSKNLESKNTDSKQNTEFINADSINSQNLDSKQNAQNIESSNLDSKNLENIESKKQNIILNSAKQVGAPIFFALIIIVVSFLPIFALSGQEERLFAPLAFTKTFAMLIGAILSITIVPILMLLFIKGKIIAEQRNPINRFCINIYKVALNFTLKIKKIFLVACVLSLPIFLLIYKNLNWEFMPKINEGVIMYMPVSNASPNIESSVAYLKKVDSIIKSFDEVESVFGKAGRANTSSDSAPLSMLEVYIHLKPQSEWKEKITYEQLRDKLESALQIEGLTNSWTYPIRGRTDMLLTGIRTPLGIKLYGSDRAILQDLSLQIESRLKAMEASLSVFAERANSGYYLDITPIDSKLARYGVSREAIFLAVNSAIGGAEITRMIKGVENYPITMRLRDYERNDIESIKDIYVKTALGFYPLGELADISYTNSPNELKSEKGLGVNYIYITPRENVSASTYKALALQALSDLRLPSGYFYEFSGESEYLEAAKERLSYIVPLSLLLIFVLIFMALKDAGYALLCFCTLPFAICGGILGIEIMGYNLNIAGVVGLLALLGVASETSIVMLLYLDTSFREFGLDSKFGNFSGRNISIFRIFKSGFKDCIESNYNKRLLECVIHGAAKRVRPKLMTAISIIASLIPIMLSSGVGSEVMKAIATPMLFGMLTSTILTLFIIPLCFYIMKSSKF